MDEKEYSPPESPTEEDQRDALKKGLGRAVMWAKAGKLNADVLLEACLHDWRYDWQCESNRSQWLWEIMNECGVVNQLRNQILAAFESIADEHVAAQLCGFARLYATRGDNQFRTRLYEFVESKRYPTMDWLGESELIELDGEIGFEFVASVRGLRFESDPDEWHDGSLMDQAIERWGRDRVIQLLTDSEKPGCLSFLKAWFDKHSDAENKPMEAHRDRMRAIPISEVLSSADREERCVWMRGWGMNAEEADLRIVLDAIRQEASPHRLARLLRVFSGRTMPEFEPHILELAMHANRDVRDAANRALKPNRHPAIRALALEMLAEPEWASQAVDLFVNNYCPGDEKLIFDVISRMTDEDDLHSSLLDYRNLLDAHPDIAFSQIDLFSYRWTPCSECRYYIADSLKERNAIPEWMKVELQFDANEECRAIVLGKNETEKNDL